MVHRHWTKIEPKKLVKHWTWKFYLIDLLELKCQQLEIAYVVSHVYIHVCEHLKYNKNIY